MSLPRLNQLAVRNRLNADLTLRIRDGQQRSIRADSQHARLRGHVRKRLWQRLRNPPQTDQIVTATRDQSLDDSGRRRCRDRWLGSRSGRCRASSRNSSRRGGASGGGWNDCGLNDRCQRSDGSRRVDLGKQLLLGSAPHANRLVRRGRVQLGSVVREPQRGYRARVSDERSRELSLRQAPKLDRMIYRTGGHQVAGRTYCDSRHGVG